MSLAEAALTDADTSQAFSLGKLPAGAMVLGAGISLATPFTGGGASAVTVDIGTAGDPNAIVAASNVLAAAVDGEASTIPAGIAPHKAVAAETELFATINSTGANLNALTAGAMAITVTYAEPQA